MLRVELKYLVSVELRDELKKAIKPFLVHDYFSRKMINNTYTVRSVYLDTIELNSYHEKLAGLKIRNKFRIRGYNDLTDNTAVFVEIKRKDGIYIWKDRIPVMFDQLNSFLNDCDITKIINHSIDYNKKLEAANNFFYYYSKNKLKPVVNVVYEREAFECKFGSGLRVTFDENLRSFLTQTYFNLFDNPEMQFILPEYFILEIKYYNALPPWVFQIINKYNLRKEAVSKYTLSIDKHLQNKFFV